MKSRKRKSELRKIIRRCLDLGNWTGKYRIADINDIGDDYFYWKARYALKQLSNGRDLIGEKYDTRNTL
jgi:hypothetical protein